MVTKVVAGAGAAGAIGAIGAIGGAARERASVALRLVWVPLVAWENSNSSSTARIAQWKPVETERVPSGMRTTGGGVVGNGSESGRQERQVQEEEQREAEAAEAAEDI